MLDQYRDLLTTEELASVMRSSESYIANLRSKNKELLPKAVKFGRRVLYRKCDVIEFINDKVEQEESQPRVRSVM